MTAPGPGGPGPGPEYVTVGLVLRAFGASGQVKVRALTDFPDRLLELKRVRVKRSGPMAGRPEWREVATVEEQGDGGFVLRLEGVASREQAAALLGSELEIEAGEVRPLPPDRFYRFQVVGLTVKDEAGRTLGKVGDVLETGANDVFVVVPEDGGPRAEILIPALRDVVLALDLQAGEMVVRPLRPWGDRS